MCFINAGSGFVTVEHQTQPEPSLKVNMNRQKIATVGRPALGNLIHKLHVYRCIKDVARGSSLVESLTRVNEPALGWRKALNAKRLARTLFMHVNTELVTDRVMLKKYPETKEGLIQSWLDRQPAS